MIALLVYLLPIIGWLLYWIAVFWAVIFVIWWRHFFLVRQSDREAPADRRWRIATERLSLRVDLRKQAKRQRQRRRRDLSGALSPRQLRAILSSLDTGLAENKTTALEDEQNELWGDHWLSRRRPVWFAVVFQLPLALVLAVPFSLFLPLLLASFAAVVVVTILVGYWSHEIVDEKERLAVKRFGVNVNFLGPGLQFLLPWIEKGKFIHLRNSTWGPGETPREEDKVPNDYLGGCLGTSANPSPGTFTVQLSAKWLLTIIVVIQLRTYRQHRWAWYATVYDWLNASDVGKRLGAIVSAILQTRAREVEPKKEDRDDPAAFATSVLKLLNLLPEICAEIIIRLEEAELAGLLIESVSISSIEPSEEFLNLLQRPDQERVEGAATAERRRLELAQLQDVPEDMRALFVQMEQQSNFELFAQRNESGGAIAALIALQALKSK